MVMNGRAEGAGGTPPAYGTAWAAQAAGRRASKRYQAPSLVPHPPDPTEAECPGIMTMISLVSFTS